MSTVVSCEDSGFAGGGGLGHTGMVITGGDMGIMLHRQRIFHRLLGDHHRPLHHRGRHDLMVHRTSDNCTLPNP
ncbi:MAG: hypothetical protein Q8922_11955 [Bacteroidota bacterium]|nr:hypothetical protein [Bacteroidota bacterium]MDP4233297.1 hypothetical protein [Bacteroidota bacterium]MDP4242083.1 hypothetical protein [Bacteroidota bacterium]MDP4288638.1 hypothetical protein [Bacteroidota bacterium]